MKAVASSSDDARRRYEAYLDSPGWEMLRIAALKRDGGRCRLCNSEARPEVHHRHYVWPWERTQVDDLTTLCSTCHASFHGRTPRVLAMVLGAFWVGFLLGAFLSF